MELDVSLWDILGEGQGEDEVLGDSFENQLGIVFEVEAVVVGWVAYEDAALCV